MSDQRQSLSGMPLSTDNADVELVDLDSSSPQPFGQSSPPVLQTNGPSVSHDSRTRSHDSSDGDVSKSELEGLPSSRNLPDTYTTRVPDTGSETGIPVKKSSEIPTSSRPVVVNSIRPLPVRSPSTGNGSANVKRRSNSLPDKDVAAPLSAIPFVDTDLGQTNTNSLPRPGENSYDKLDLTRPQSQHLYRPIVEGGTSSSSGASRPSASSRPVPPAYDSCAVNIAPPPRQEMRPLLPQAGASPSENADLIVELPPSESQEPRAKEKKVTIKDKKPEITDIPNTNFAIACMVTLCFNLPLGILAMYCSLQAVKAFQDGKKKLGESRSRWSIILSLLGITITTVIISSVVLWIAVQGQKKINRDKAYSTKSGLNL